MAFVFWSCGASFLHPLLQLKSHAYGFHGLCGFCGLCSTSYVLRNVLDVCSCGIVELEQFMALTSVAFLASLVFPFFGFCCVCAGLMFALHFFCVCLRTLKVLTCFLASVAVVTFLASVIARFLRGLGRGCFYELFVSPMASAYCNRS